LMFDADDEIKPAIGIEPAADNLLVIVGGKIEDRFKETFLLAQAIEAAIATFAADGVIVIPGSLLTAEQAKELGFDDIQSVRLAGSTPEFLIRDNCNKHTPPWQNESG